MDDKLLTKVNAIDTSGFVLKTLKNQVLKRKLRTLTKKIPATRGLEWDYNAKIMEIEGKIPFATGLATTAALNVVVNKILNASSLLKKEIVMQKYQTLRLNILGWNLKIVRLPSSAPGTVRNKFW